MVLDEAALATIFTQARTHWQFTDQPVTDDELQAVYDLAKLGPTSANCCPARFAFVRTAEAKERLRACLSAGNIDKVMAAPVTVIIAQDTLFYQKLPVLMPGVDAKAWFSGNPDLAEDTASRNAVLQGAYFIIAARALGLDCGAMSGFDKQKTDRAFFHANGWKSNFLLNLGHAAAGELPPRLPKLDFADVTLFA